MQTYLFPEPHSQFIHLIIYFILLFNSSMAFQILPEGHLAVVGVLTSSGPHLTTSLAAPTCMMSLLPLPLLRQTAKPANRPSLGYMQPCKPCVNKVIHRTQYTHPYTSRLVEPSIIHDLLNKNQFRCLRILYIIYAKMLNTEC